VTTAVATTCPLGLATAEHWRADGSCRCGPTAAAHERSHEDLARLGMALVANREQQVQDRGPYTALCDGVRNHLREYHGGTIPPPLVTLVDLQDTHRAAHNPSEREEA
jgi:hypothetical protein